jgi:DNA (cytosine-5)-methyltransferase 1
VLSLFSGIGGLDIAAEWAGMEIVAFCEIEPYAVKVLQRRWPDVPIFGDVCSLTRDTLVERGIRSDDIDCIIGGFPCQPFSVAGKRKGAKDERFLWGEFSRLIGEIRPSWVVAENVPGLISIALDDVLADLESHGYGCLTFVYPASAVGAPHRRERVFILAYRHEPRLERRHSGKLSKRACKWSFGQGSTSG